MESPRIAYSVEQIAYETSLSKTFIRSQIRDGKLKARKIGKRLLVLSQDLQNYLQGEENKDEN